LTYRIRDWNEIFENNRTRELKRLEWVPVPNKMDGSGYRELIDHENGAGHLGARYAILEISSRQKVRGTIPQESAAERGDIPQDLAATCRCLSRVSGLPTKVFTEVIPRLVQIGWVEELETVRNLRDRTIPQDDAEKCLSRAREGNGMEGNGKEQKHVATATSAPEEFQLSAPPPSPVRPSVPAGPTFDDWWKLYWNHDAKKDALKAWPVAVKKKGAQFLVDQVTAYRQRFEETDKWEFKSRMLPATWLRGERWNDKCGPEVARNGSRAPARQSRSDAITEALKGFDE